MALGPRLSSAVDRSREALRPSHTQDAHALDAAVLELGEYVEPRTSPLATIAGPDAEDVMPSTALRTQHVERLVSDLPIAQVHHDRVDEHQPHRVHAVSVSTVFSLVPLRAFSPIPEP